MLKVIVLSGTMLLASAGISVGVPFAPTPADKTFPLTVPAHLVDGRGGLPEKVGRTIVREDDGLFYINAQVNGMPVRFVVDTGSNVVVLTQRDAVRVGMAPSATTSAEMRTVGGATRMRSGTVARIDIAGQSLKNVDAATVEGGLGVSLLGQSALSQMQSITFAGDRLEMNYQPSGRLGTTFRDRRTQAAASPKSKARVRLPQE
jgi:aspartyl protease family protein